MIGQIELMDNKLFRNQQPMQGINVRLAKHAGSWYSNKRQLLDKQLSDYLLKAEAQLKGIKAVRAIIAPHAGYAYSGATAAWAYRYLQQCHSSQSGHKIGRIFLLGPSHKKYIRGCSISQLGELQTPLGNLIVDTEQIKVLQSKQKFARLLKKQEQNEHSLQMHLPYIYKVFNQDVKIIPIIVGDNDLKSCQAYGRLFAEYFGRDDTLFIVSSDFCHWGEHFQYQPFIQPKPKDKKEKENKDRKIWESIQQMDRQGMELIQKHNLQGFIQYLERTGNTICGEQPIRLLLSTINESKLAPRTQFVSYAQSDRVTDSEGSSVSYASAVSYICQQQQ